MVAKKVLIGFWVQLQRVPYPCKAFIVRQKKSKKHSDSEIVINISARASRYMSTSGEYKVSPGYFS